MVLFYVCVLSPSIDGIILYKSLSLSIDGIILYKSLSLSIDGIIYLVSQ